MSEDEAPRNVVRVEPGGPFVVEGDVEVRAADGGTIREARRVALCRCGASRNKPFCDGTHIDVSFADAARVRGVASHKPDPATATGRLVVTRAPEGPLLVVGSFDLEGASGRLGFRQGRAALCGCGASAMSPLCDGAHTDTAADPNA